MDHDRAGSPARSSFSGPTRQSIGGGRQGGTRIDTVATLPVQPRARIATGRAHGCVLIRKYARKVPVDVARKRTILGPSVVIAVRVTGSAGRNPFPTTTSGVVSTTRSFGAPCAHGTTASAAAHAATSVIVRMAPA